MYRKKKLEMKNGRGNHVDFMICLGYTCNLVRSNTLIHFHISFQIEFMGTRISLTFTIKSFSLFLSSLFILCRREERIGQTVIKTYIVYTSSFNFETMSFRTLAHRRLLFFSNCNKTLFHNSIATLLYEVGFELNWVGLWSNNEIQSSKSNKPRVRYGIVPKRCHNVRNVVFFYVPFN